MKDLKISKELIKSVLVNETKNLSEDFSFYIDEDYIVFRDEGETLFDYNIYKFTFKNCIEWANEKGYSVKPFLVQGYDNWTIEFDYETWDCIKIIDGEAFGYLGIIKACNWILEKEIQEENRLQLQEELTEYYKPITEGL